MTPWDLGVDMCVGKCARKERAHMTKLNMAGRDRQEVEVTSEMREVGAAIIESLEGVVSGETLAERLFLAMLSRTPANQAASTARFRGPGNRRVSVR